MLRRWNGEQFMANGTIRRWNGTEFVPLPETLFDPLSIADLQIWLNADTMSAGATGAWLDQTTNHNDFSTGAHFNSPVVVSTIINGHNVVSFSSASTQALRWTGTGLGGDFHSFTVARMLAGGTWARLIGSIYPENANFTAGWHGGNQGAFYNNSVFVGTSVPVQANIWKIAEMEGNSPTDTWMNGSSWGTGGGGSGFNNGVALSGFGLASDSELSDCQIAEVLIWNRKLGVDERADVYNYLSEKYAI